VGKSNQSYDKAVPKRRIKTNDEDEDFDWREELNRIKAEEEAENEIENSLENAQELDKREDEENA
jgi:hypothetical protein